MNSTFKTVMLWMSLLVVVFLAWHFAQFQKKETPVKFSEFMAQVEAGVRLASAALNLTMGVDRGLAHGQDRSVRPRSEVRHARNRVSSSHLGVAAGTARER